MAQRMQNGHVACIHGMAVQHEAVQGLGMSCAMHEMTMCIPCLRPTYSRSTTWLLPGYSWKTIDPARPGDDPRGYFQHS